MSHETTVITNYKSLNNNEKYYTNRYLYQRMYNNSRTNTNHNCNFNRYNNIWSIENRINLNNLLNNYRIVFYQNQNYNVKCSFEWSTMKLTRTGNKTQYNIVLKIIILVLNVNVNLCVAFETIDVTLPKLASRKTD